jgi:hypothetical protein
MTMARSRALMTDTDREWIKKDTDKNRRYQIVSVVRNRINEELAEDIEILEEHHPELLAELRDVVCESDD